MLTFNNRILKITTTSKFDRLQDFVEPYSYCGLAETGSATSSNVWKITRIEIFLDGTTSIKTAQNVAWDNRYSAIYS